MQQQQANLDLRCCSLHGSNAIDHGLTPGVLMRSRVKHSAGKEGILIPLLIPNGVCQ